MTLKTPPTEMKRDKATDRAYVYYGGRKTYFGKYGSRAAAKAFAEWLRDQLADGEAESHSEPFVADCIAAFLEYAIVYYSENGHPTGEYRNLSSSAQILIDFRLATLRASSFGPGCLLKLQSEMASTAKSADDQTPKWARSTINSHIKRIRRIFRWCASREIIPASIVSGLELVDSIPANRNMARETAPIAPVDVKHVLATLPHLSPTVQSMVRVQLICGMRPQDVCRMTTEQIDTSDTIWFYRPEKHKNALRGKSLTKAIPTIAQKILAPLIRQFPTGPLFSPRESLDYWWSQSRKPGKTPPKQSKERRPYTSGSYGKAIAYAIGRANKDKVIVPHWAPNQLRHLIGTHVRDEFGLEAAQIYLGHAKPDVTLNYAKVTEQQLLVIAAGLSSPLDNPQG